MRKVIFLIHISLDIYVTIPNSEIYYIIYTNELKRYIYNLHKSTNTYIYNRVTYQMIESY